jgi:hypothetical protein
MKEEQYWLIILKAEDLFGADPFGGKEIAKVIALTSTPKEPEFSTVMDGIMDGLRIGRRTDAAYSYDIAPLYLDRQFLDKLPSLHKWDGKDLKLWVASRSKDA